LFLFLKDADLIGCEIIAIDGTSRAQQQESELQS
jgi:putative N-acetylmannosamine-6-phosphate epimerase